MINEESFNKEETMNIKRGITAGAFDLLHAGHCLLLREAHKHCDFLIVALQKDPSLTPEEYRGKKKNKPIQSLNERYIQLASCRYVDQIVVYNTEDELRQIFTEMRANIYFIGADWKNKKFTGWDLPMEVHFGSRDHSFSTTELRERIKNA